ncbi:hypothetical protein [Vibrio owensii]|uniref:hypothetical protein n=1 Tax=Vibrio harveyi group TaxID=717610 RepID=UPI003CC56DC9
MSFGVRLRHLNLKLHTAKGHDLYALCMQGSGLKCKESDFLFFNNLKVKHFAALTKDNIMSIDLDQARKAGYSKIVVGAFITESLEGNLAQIRIDSVASEQEGGEILRTFAVKETSVDVSEDRICEILSFELQTDKGWKASNRYISYSDPSLYLANLGITVA